MMILPNPNPRISNLLSAQSIYLFLLIYPQTTRMANITMTIMCTGMPNNWQQMNYLISHQVMLLSLWKQQWICKILGNQKNKSQPILLEAQQNLLLLIYMNIFPYRNLTIKKQTAPF